MDLGTVFLSTFLLVFIGELGDKTQIAAGTSTLANRKQTGTIFISSVLALVAVSAITVFFAGLLPKAWMPFLTIGGGIGMIIWGIHLFLKANEPDSEDSPAKKKSGWGLFFSQFSVVFLAEVGDKTMIATLAAAIENQSQLIVVFIASAGALITVTSLTIWGITKVPSRWVAKLQRIGAALMVAYGIYMLI